MTPRSSPSAARGGALVATIVVVVVLFAIAFVMATVVAAHKTKVVKARWADTFGSLDEVLERYPSTEANAAALELEGLSAAIGIDLATRQYDDRARPEPGDTAHRETKKALGEYLREQIERNDRGIAPPPPEVSAFLEARRPEIDALVSALVRGGEPKWELQLEKGWEAPVPNLLGHIDLQRLLLTDALSRAQRGELDEASQTLEASWRLNTALMDDPILITQLIAIAVARMEAGTVRRIDGIPTIWRERLYEHDFRRSFLEAMRFEGWVWTEEADRPAVHGWPSDFWQEVLYKVGKPYVTYCLADVSDDYRERLENLARIEVLCDVDLAATDADLQVPVPRWNLVGETVVPNLAGALDRLRRLELDIEMTAKLLQIRAVRDDNDGRWAETLAGIEHSAVCPDDRWIYESSPDGTMTITLSRDVSWPGQMGAVLPTRYEFR